MYSSGYSQVNSPEAKRKMQYRSKGKSCGYYMRIVFFFSSLIQSLIIVSLVLFLLYGNKQDTSVGDRVQELEESFSRLSIENVDLKKQRKNLTNLLNVTLTKKADIEYDLLTLHRATNISVLMFHDLNRKLQMCNTESSNYKIKCISAAQIIPPPPFPAGSECKLLETQLKYVESNFTDTVKKMGINMEQIAKEKDKLDMDAIILRRERSILESELNQYKLKSKEEFSQLLSSVSTVSKALLEKIDSLFPRHIAFQLTCAKQREHLEQIHTNCTSLSREVEDKLQRYLNNVGEQLSDMEQQNNHLKAENGRLAEDYRDCSKNCKAIIEQNSQSNKEVQKKHDEEKERLLMDKIKLNGDIEVLKSWDKYRTSEVAHLNDKLKQLNMSCMLKAGLGGGLGPRPGTPSQSGWGGSRSASSGSTSLGQGSTGSGSSFNPGLVFNKPGATGSGSSRSTFPQSGSSSNLSNTGSGSSRPASAGGAVSSTGLGPSFRSDGNGLNKPAESGRTSTDSRSSSGSTGSSKSGSTSSGFTWLWDSSSTVDHSKTDNVPGKTSSGTSYGGTGSSGGGKASGLASDAGGVMQHVQMLQRLINPSAPQEKQDLYKLLG